MDLDSTQIMDLMHSRVRRRFARGLKRKPMGLIKRLRKEKTKVAPGEKPETVKTHLRDMIIVPEMIGSQIGVYNGKVFNTIEIKVRLITRFLSLFSSLFRGRSVIRARGRWSDICLFSLTAGDVRPLPWRVLHHLQAGLSRSRRYRCHQVVPLRAAQVNTTSADSALEGRTHNKKRAGGARGALLRRRMRAGCS